MLEAFQRLSVPALGLDGLVEHLDGQRQFVGASLGSAFEEHIVALGVEVAIGVLFDDTGRRVTHRLCIAIYPRGETPEPYCLVRAWTTPMRPPVLAIG
jgi:hypothetical protein